MAFNMLLTGTNSNLNIYYNKKKYTYVHETGKAVIFNSELFHNACNNGSTNRVILYIDFEI
jgi:ectoine hydroxylase-related dioxygenase (phytanoyl-CoA dioxygenase family)